MHFCTASKFYPQVTYTNTDLLSPSPFLIVQISLPLQYLILWFLSEDSWNQRPYQGFTPAYLESTIITWNSFFLCLRFQALVIYPLIYREHTMTHLELNDDQWQIQCEFFCLSSLSLGILNLRKSSRDYCYNLATTLCIFLSLERP